MKRTVMQTISMAIAMVIGLSGVPAYAAESIRDIDYVNEKLDETNNEEAIQNQDGVEADFLTEIVCEMHGYEGDIFELNLMANEVIKHVDPSWSDFDKTLYIHDWILDHVTYDEEEAEVGWSHPSSRSAQGVLETGMAVCDGYAELFKYLANKLGMECHWVSSDILNHSWNIIKVDGSWYYVDCTWDDIARPNIQRYENFLCGRDEFHKTHDSTDWEDRTTGENIYYNDISSAYYDKTVRMGTDSLLSMPVHGGNWIFRSGFYCYYDPATKLKTELKDALGIGRDSLYIEDVFTMDSLIVVVMRDNTMVYDSDSNAIVREFGRTFSGYDYVLNDYGMLRFMDSNYMQEDIQVDMLDLTDYVYSDSTYKKETYENNVPLYREAVFRSPIKDFAISINAGKMRLDDTTSDDLMDSIGGDDREYYRIFGEKIITDGIVKCVTIAEEPEAVANRYEDPYRPQVVEVDWTKHNATSGKINNQASWSYSDHVLRIMGSGDIGYGKWPWNYFLDVVKTVYIDEGISGLFSIYSCEYPMTVYYAGSKDSLRWWDPTNKEMHYGKVHISFVTFNDDYSFPDVDISSGSTVSEPPSMEMRGYEFGGWHRLDIEHGCNEASDFDFSTPITEDIVLRAQWNKILTVYYHSNGGKGTSSGVVAENNLLEKPADPIKEGYVFAGWYYDPKLRNDYMYDFETPEDGYKTTSNYFDLYAKWMEPSNSTEKVVITFDAMGGSADRQSQTVVYGQQYGSLPVPTQGSLGFMGWYTKPSGGSRISESAIVSNSQSHTLYARWKDVNADETEPVLFLTGSGFVVSQKIDARKYLQEELGTSFDKISVTPKGYASVSSSGIVTLKKAGAVEINGLVKEGKKWVVEDTVLVDVLKPTYENKTIVSVKAGEKIESVRNIVGSDITPEKWVCSNSNVATVDPETGVVTTIGSGKAKISALYGAATFGVKSASYSYTIKVVKPQISKSSASMMTGGKLRLSMKNAAGKDICWITSDSLIADVDIDTGLVEAFECGTVTISAMIDDLEYPCEITVTPPRLKQERITLKTGKSKKLSVTNTKLKDGMWSSSDYSVVDVDIQTGKVTALSPGTATVSVNIGGATCTCEVTVI